MKKLTEAASLNSLTPFQTNYGPRVAPVLITGDDTHVKQSFLDECDINNIMQRFNKTGTLPDLIKENPRYGDFATVPDYQTSLNIVHMANEQFSALSAEVRERFANDPEKFLQFVHNENNIPEMINLGLAIQKNEQNDQTKSSTHTDQQNTIPSKNNESKTSSSKPTKDSI